MIATAERITDREPRRYTDSELLAVHTNDEFTQLTEEERQRRIKALIEGPKS